MISCDDARDLIVSYVTGDLKGEEARALLEHLAHCAACAAYLRELAQLTPLLPYGLPPVQPPPALKEKVLSALRGEWEAGAGEAGKGEASLAAPAAELAGGLSPAGAHPPAWPGSPAAAEQTGGRATRAQPRPRGGWDPLRRLRAGWVAAALAVALPAGWLWQQQGQLRRLSGAVVRSQAELAAAASVLGEGELRPAWILRLTKEPAFSQAWGRATLYRTHYGDVLVVAMGGLPPVQGERVYRLWLLQGGKRVDGGSVRPDAAGFAFLLVHREIFQYDAIGLTLEPDGAVLEQPRGPRVLFASVAQAQAPGGGPAGGAGSAEEWP